MWVRSQDKEKLVNCNEFRIVEGACLLNGKYTIESNHYILGIYDTKAKALEVLDDIRHYIVHHPLAVYNMPLNEEVD